MNFYMYLIQYVVCPARRQQSQSRCSLQSDGGGGMVGGWYLL